MTGKNSTNQSRDFFQNGFVAVFQKTKINEDLLKRTANVLYEDARCGFFHDGMFRSRLVFTSRQWALEITLPKQNGIIDQTGEIQSIMINPCLFHEALVSHFDELLKKIREGTDISLVENFKKGWELRKGVPPIIGINDPEPHAKHKD